MAFASVKEKLGCFGVKHKGEGEAEEVESKKPSSETASEKSYHCNCTRTTGMCVRASKLGRARCAADKKITQQELGACKPVLNKGVVTLVFLTVTVVFIPIGVVCLIYGMRVSHACMPPLL